MLQFLVDMLRSPEAQPDGYAWVAVLLAHSAIGLFGTALLIRLLGAWRSAALIVAVYALLWEGAQLGLYGGTVTDGAVDAAAVASGAFLAAGLWQNRFAAVAASLIALAAIGYSGVRGRK